MLCLVSGSKQSRFTDRSRFPKDAEIGIGAAFFEVDAMDSMDIVCPTYSTQDSTNKYEQLIIHQVSDLSFMSCELDSRSQAFLVCDSPLAVVPVTHKIIFRQLSPSSNGFEYQPGRSYYLITTSNGSVEGMNNSRLGLCVTANLRLRIDVRPSDTHDFLESQEEPHFHVKLVSANPTSLLEASCVFQAHGGLSNESQKFAAKHGLDLTRLEYVRQLAMDGVEGDFSFRQLQNSTSKVSTNGAQAPLTSGPGRPYISSAAAEDGSEAFHSTSRQSQRWISREKQSRFGSVRDAFLGEDTDAMDTEQDYVVDDASSMCVRDYRVGTLTNP
ncbi:unnamed protein product [Gongylonema pulchrum]|uniref:Ephrin RBD domain-containing protein n=1 Tax=Gongylonema pulchrum TaxID=637853 RepID=A0A183DNE9_9BILA|nr:unnamed protein product [Gongylonema pulchrum]